MRQYLITTAFFIMKFSKSPYILFRDYPEFGYLTDNRNFGYNTASKSCKRVGDRIISKVGGVFYSALTDTPKSLHEISDTLSRIFTDISQSELENDAQEFFIDLAKDDFVLCSKSTNEISSSSWFSYDNCKSYTSDIVENSEETSLFNDKWFAKSRLTRVHLCVSSVCNEKCIHCYYPRNLKGEFMSNDLFLKILEQCQRLNVLNITLSGGEPTLNDNLLFFIQEARKRNFSINVLSNLTSITDTLLHEFQKTPLLSVQTSLYSMDENVHDSITSVKGSHKKTIEAIETLRKFNIPMQINVPIMKQNKNTFRAVLEWAKSLNIEASSDYLLFGCFDGSCKNLQCRLDISEIEDLLSNENPSNPISEATSQLSATSSICPVCYSSLCVSPSGNVYPCEGWQSCILGNLNDVSIAEIWGESKKVKNLRALTINDFPKCLHCNDKDFCSICLIRNVNESENLDCHDINPYFCSIAKVKHQLRSDTEK